MNFSNEELYFQFGQYDTLIFISFLPGSPSRGSFGKEIGGKIIYPESERAALAKLFSEGNDIPRTRKKIRLAVSDVYELGNDVKAELERFGFDCGDIEVIHTYNKPWENHFLKAGKKDVAKFEVTYNFSGWTIDDAHNIGFGVLNRRFLEGGVLAPFEVSQLLAFKQYRGEDISQPPFDEMLAGREEDVEFYFCKTEFERLGYSDNVDPEDVSERFLKRYADVFLNRYWKRKKAIDQELQKAGGNIKTVVLQYQEKIQALYSACNGFEGEIYYVHEKVVYLEFDRFVHIYVRHVSETQVGENFQGKTVFQYKFDDIKYLIAAVIGSIKDEIFDHFINTPAKPFRRQNARSVYFDGHYYRVMIDPSGALVDFHPYNYNEDNPVAADE